jgi:hypothetical protein
MSAMGHDLVTVTVETHLGAKYVFPDMPRHALDNVIKGAVWKSSGHLVLVNVSAAVLSLEARLVKCVEYDGEVKWGDAPLYQLPESG